MSKVFNREIKLCGTVVDGVRVLARDNDGYVLLASGTSAPTGAGYAKSCLFIKTDATSGTKGLYENQGTTSSASFNVVGDIVEAEIGTGAVTNTKLGADAVDGAKIADDAVSLEHLDSGITPSHIVVAAGEFTTAGGDAAEQATVTGVVATDIVVASLLENGTNSVTLLQSVAGAGVIDFTMSGDPSTDAVISYVVLRAAA